MPLHIKRKHFFTWKKNIRLYENIKRREKEEKKNCFVTWKTSKEKIEIKKNCFSRWKCYFKIFFPVRQNHYTLQHLLVLTIMTQCDVASTYFILKPKESKSARSKQQWRWKCSDYESFLCSYDHSLVSLFLLVLSGSVPPSDCNHPPCKGNSNPPGRNHQNFQCQYHHPLAYI